MRVRHAVLALLLISCSQNSGEKHTGPQCSDGIDNDGDGLIDFPDDPGCTSPNDDSEDSAPSPQCSDGRDNDGDGKIDYPDDPGCDSPLEDSELDDCPSGPSCPQCSNGIDDDGNGQIDYPNDPGCTSAADPTEAPDNPFACGTSVPLLPLPSDGHATGTIGPHQTSNLTGSCGGGGGEAVYEFYVRQPSVLTATTATPATSMRTALYVRGANCASAASELACVVDESNDATESTLNVSLPTPGLYYVIVDGETSDDSGGYDLTVKLANGEGVACAVQADCGARLYCRIPLGGTALSCQKPMCSDGVDDDGDGKADYPDDPGCASPDDNDETDDCATHGPNCPECGDGIDNDGDGKIDYPADTSCSAAGDASEECVTTDGTQLVTTKTITGNTTTANNDVTPSCGDSTGNAPDRVYRLDVPALTNLTITTTVPDDFDAVTSLYGATCGGTALDCEDFDPIVKTTVAAGSYYVVIDGYTDGDEGKYSIAIDGTVKVGGKCDSPLTDSGAVHCTTGYACKGTAGARTCQLAKCSDGIDNDGDGKIDYPNDPGCASPSGDDETDPAVEPVCSDTLDNDTDGKIDWPADYGCTSAAGTSEIFCIGEQDPTSLITTKTVTGNTTNLHDDITPSCGGADAPDQAFALQLPVPVATLTLDTLTSPIDTVLSMRDAQCLTELGCNDDGPTDLTSKLVLTGVAAGGYAISVEGYSDGAFTLHVHGVVATGTSCTSALFTGTTAVLACPTGTTCTGTPKTCK